MPVRSRIHSSEVSTMCSRSRFVSTRSGTYIPVPVMVAPRMASGRRIMVRLDLLADVLVHAILHEPHQGADRAADRARPARAVTHEAYPVHAQEGRGAELLPVDAGPQPLERRHHEERPGLGQRVAFQLLLHHVAEE